MFTKIVLATVLAGSQAASNPGHLQPAQYHALVIIAGTLAEKNRPEAARTIVQITWADSGLTRTNRAQLRLVDAMLREASNDAAGAQKMIADALSLDRNVRFVATTSPRLQGLLEEMRSLLPPPSSPQPPPSAEPPGREPPGKALVKATDALYTSAQPEAADLVLQIAEQYGPFSSEEQEQLALRQGIVRAELFDDLGSLRAFKRALELDRAATLPDYAPAKTLRIFEELRRSLPPVVARAPHQLESVPAAPYTEARPATSNTLTNTSAQHTVSTNMIAPSQNVQVVMSAQPGLLWYGWQPLVIDGLGASLLLFNNGSFLPATAAVYTLGPPAIHMLGGHAVTGLIDLVLRVGLPVGGFFLGSVPGAVVGAIAAAVLDVGLLSWTPPSRYADASSTWVPIAGLVQGSPFAGVAGTF